VNFLKQHLKQVPFAVAIILLLLNQHIAAVVVFGIGLGLAIWHAVEKVKREDP